VTPVTEFARKSRKKQLFPPYNMCSYGHIRDLKKKEFSIDVEKNFEPDYEIPEDKKTLVKTLKSEAKEADTVWWLPMRTAREKHRVALV